MIEQAAKRVSHVIISEIPGTPPASKHRPVIALCVSNDLGVFTRGEEFPREFAIPLVMSNPLRRISSN
jgi:hypothetical protein